MAEKEIRHVCSSGMRMPGCEMAASIAAHTARAQAKNSPSPAIAGMGSVRVVKRWGRWDSSPPRFCCAQFCARTSCLM